jgi:hypothetical protein
LAIRFPCEQCRQLLSIASRKAGRQIHCPKCGAAQVVPCQSDPPADLPELQNGVEPNGETAVEVADEPGTSWTISPPPPPVSTQPSGKQIQDNQEIAPPPIEIGTIDGIDPTSKAIPLLSPPLEPPLKSHPTPALDWILFRRRTIYLQGVLFLLLACLSFALGLFAGQSFRYMPAPVAVQAEPVKPKPKPKNQILIEGRAVYDPGTGRLTGDADTVVLAVPATHVPAEPILTAGLRPQDPAPSPTLIAVKQLEQIGGGLARVNADGDFSVVLPGEGEYRVLWISRHASRAKDEAIDASDREEMEHYFRGIDVLIGTSKYRWMPADFRPRLAPLSHSFGADGKE